MVLTTYIPMNFKLHIVFLGNNFFYFFGDTINENCKQTAAGET